MARSRRPHDRLRETRLALVRQGICESIAPHDLRVGEDEACRMRPHAVDLGMVRILCGSGADYGMPSGVRIGAAILDLITAALSVRADRFQAAVHGRSRAWHGSPRRGGGDPPA